MGRRVKASEVTEGQWLRSCRTGWLYRVRAVRIVGNATYQGRPLVRVSMCRRFVGKDSRAITSWCGHEFDSRGFETATPPSGHEGTTVFGKLAGDHP